MIPETAKYNDLVPKADVADWPVMTAKQVVAFRHWTGLKLIPDSVLVRKGPHIFRIERHYDKARCVYCHDRQF